MTSLQLLCEGPCNPQDASVMADVTAFRAKYWGGSVVPVPDYLAVPLRTLKHTEHHSTHDEWATCIECGHLRRHNRIF